MNIEKGPFCFFSGFIGEKLVGACFTQAYSFCFLFLSSLWTLLTEKGAEEVLPGLGFRSFLSAALKVYPVHPAGVVHYFLAYFYERSILQHNRCCSQDDSRLDFAHFWFTVLINIDFSWVRVLSRNGVRWVFKVSIWTKMEYYPMQCWIPSMSCENCQ